MVEIMEVGFWLTLPNTECSYLLLHRKKDADGGFLYLKPNMFNLTPKSHVLNLLNIFLFRNIMIQKHDGITVAVHKMAS